MPVAVFDSGFVSTFHAIALGMSVQWPLFSASATVVNAELKYECVVQPRSHGPQ